MLFQIDILEFLNYYQKFPKIMPPFMKFFQKKTFKISLNVIQEAF